MLTLLSPAKKLDLEQTISPITPTEPALLGQTKILARTMKTKSAADLQKLMKLSEKLAELNAGRFKSFTLNGRSNSAKPAAFTFDGNVYEGLEASSLTAKDLDYAQDHLRILSGLYGALRPMDLVQPYRLEMGTRLETPRGKNLYQFWGTEIADKLMADLAGHKDQPSSTSPPSSISKPWIRKRFRPRHRSQFLNIKDGDARNLNVLRQTRPRPYDQMDHGKPHRNGR